MAPALAPLPPHEELGLVQRAMNGDQQAFGHLYQHYLEPIYRYIYFRVGDVADAEDLTEQIFIKAWEALPQYKPQSGKFSNWLYRIAHNAAVDHHRQRKSSPLQPLPDERLPVGRQTSALEEVIRAEEAAVLAAAIAQLSDDQQQVILLRFIEGLRHAEVARLLKRSEGNCRALQFQALAALHRRLVNWNEGS